MDADFSRLIHRGGFLDDVSKDSTHNSFTPYCRVGYTKILNRKIGAKRFLEITPVFPAISCLGMYAIVFIATALESKIILANPS